MWLLNRLWPGRSRPVPLPPEPAVLAEPGNRRTPLKRTARVGRTGMAPWQKVAPGRRLHH